MTPSWILDVFAAIMLMVAAVGATRLVAAQPWRRGTIITDNDVAHLLMGIAMAGMLAPGLATLPNDVWAAVFCVLTAWFGYRVVRGWQAIGARALVVDHCAPHLAHSAAMVYVFLAVAVPAAGGSGMAGMPGMAGMDMSGAGGMPTLRVPTLAFVFALALVGYAVWDLDQLAGLRHGFVVAAAGSSGPVLAGAVAAGLPPGGGGVAGSGATDGRRPRPLAILNAPATVVDCRIAMGVTMALMLFLMISGGWPGLGDRAAPYTSAASRPGSSGNDRRARGGIT